MIDKKRDDAEQEKLAKTKEMQAKIEKQRELAGVAEKASDDEDKIPGVTFDDSVAEVDVKFDYADWVVELEPVQKQTMAVLLEHLGVESLALRDLGKKETVAALKKVCAEKSIRTSVRKAILELYSLINRKRASILAKKQAAARMKEDNKLMQEKEAAAGEATSRNAQRKRQREVLEAFAKNRGGQGKMVKHKLNTKRLPKLFS